MKPPVLTIDFKLVNHNKRTVEVLRMTLRNSGTFVLRLIQHTDDDSLPASYRSVMFSQREVWFHVLSLKIEFWSDFPLRAIVLH